MRWEDERYVRLYTRDTADWLSLSFEAQGLLTLILRKADRAGILPLGRHGPRAVAIALGHASRWETIAPALDELLSDGCVRLEGDKLLLPNFIEAQEAAQSDAQRQRESRAKARELAAAGVTKRDGMSHAVTSRHGLSQPVTPSRAVPSVPSRAVPELLAGADAPPDGGNPVAAMGALVVQAVSQGAEPDRRAAAPRKRPKPEKPTNPRHAPMVARLVATFLEVRGSAYAFSPRDAKALATLLGMGSDDEIDQRWRRGLAGQFRERCDTLSDLVSRWNALTGQAQAPPGRVVDLRKSPVRAEDINKGEFKEIKTVDAREAFGEF